MQNMSPFQKSKDQVEQAMMIELLESVEADPHISQRTLSNEMGIAFGLVNAYLKRSIKKGWVRVKAIAPKRYLYFLTPEGFAEKSRMVKDYLSYSMAFFRDARNECEQACLFCEKNKWKKIGLVGDGDLAEIAQLVASGTSLTLAIANDNNMTEFDALLITDVCAPQETYEKASLQFNDEKIITLQLLHIRRKNNVSSQQEVQS